MERIRRTVRSRKSKTAFSRDDGILLEAGDVEALAAIKGVFRYSLDPDAAPFEPDSSAETSSAKKPRMALRSIPVQGFVLLRPRK
jgi:hypothetical protein